MRRCCTHRFQRLGAGLILGLAVAYRTQPPLPAMAPGPTMRPSLASNVAASAEQPIRVPLPVPPAARYAVALADGCLWIVTSRDRLLTPLDPTTGRPVAPPLSLPSAPVSLAAGAASLWIVSLDHQQLLRVEPLTHQVSATIDISDMPFPVYEHLWVTAGDEGVWLIGQRHVVQIDPRTNQRLGPPIAAGEEIIAYATGAGSLWTGSHDDGILARIDPATQVVTARIAMGFSIHGVAVLDGVPWVLDEHGAAVVQVDAQTNQPAVRVPIDFVAANLAAGAGALWLAPAVQNNGPTGMDWVAQLNPDTGQVVAHVPVGSAFISDYVLVLYQDGAAWAQVETSEPYIVRLTGDETAQPTACRSGATSSTLRLPTGSRGA
jgi:streptogramin lyase